MYIQNDILTGTLFIYLIQFPTVNQHGEGIKQDCVPININPLITHLSHERFITPAGALSAGALEKASADWLAQLVKY